MRLLISLLTLTASISAIAADMPKNLLRYSSGALPMVQNEDNAWVTVNPESIDWNANYSAVLAGDLGKSVNISEAKTLLVDLGAPEAVNRFSIYATEAEGTLTVYGSPIYEEPTSGNWTELGTTQFNSQAPASITFNAEARYVMLAFSQQSTGTVDSMGIFGDTMVSQMQSPNNMQSTDPLEMSFNMNYGTPATAFTIVSVTPASETETVWALFDDDPATQYNATQNTTIIADLGASRMLSKTVVNSSANGDVNIQFANELSELTTTTTTAVDGFTPFKSIGQMSPQSAQFAKISITPSAGPLSIGGISLIGPVLPNAFVFDRALGQAPAAGTNGPNDPIDNPIDPPIQNSTEPTSLIPANA